MWEYFELGLAAIIGVAALVLRGVQYLRDNRRESYDALVEKRAARRNRSAVDAASRNSGL